MSHLLLQSPVLDPLAVEKIAALSGAAGVQQLGPTVAHVLQADSAAREAVQQVCREHRIDYAYLDTLHYLKNIKLLAMDMDSTLINIECIDEIADAAGRKQEVRSEEHTSELQSRGHLVCR